MPRLCEGGYISIYISKRASMHEIKDEAFVRRRIEYQPMALHTAKVGFQPKKMVNIYFFDFLEIFTTFRT